MKVQVLIACVFGLATDAQAHAIETPVLLHLTQHGWMLPALLAIPSPQLRRHH